MHKKAVAIILAGGSGTRFWPASTKEKPKQFLKLYGDRSMIQHTFDRVSKFVNNILVVTPESQVNLVKEHLPELPKENIIVEPCARDTAAAVGLGVFEARTRFGDVPVVILPADHLILDTEKFSIAIEKALNATNKNKPFCFGVVPRSPETGYGYIEAGPLLPGIGTYKVKNFKEKPDLENAIRMLSEGNHFWNCGIYVWKAQAILDAYDKHFPVILCKYPEIKKISFDYAIVEKIQMWMIPAEFDWQDVGGWLAVESLYPKWPGGNRGNKDYIHYYSANNFVFSDGKEEIALMGVSDLIIVRSGNRTLIAHKDHLSKLKELVEKCFNDRSASPGTIPQVPEE